MEKTAIIHSRGGWMIVLAATQKCVVSTRAPRRRWEHAACRRRYRELVALCQKLSSR